jgi:hypothetical protein
MRPFKILFQYIYIPLYGFFFFFIIIIIFLLACVVEKGKLDI